MSENLDAVLESQNVRSSSERPNAFQEILKWSEALPAWQSDALRRIVRQHELSDQDFQEILTLLKAEYGLATTTAPSVKLSKSDIPAYSAKTSKVVLEKMHELKNVNAIVPDQAIKFGASGVTIIYGHNASGKSGYARVLKKACRARGEKDEVLSNVFSGALSGPAEATINIHDGSAPQSVKWKDGSTPPDSLAGINVFDSKCARVYVEDSMEVLYVPYGLDVFDKLAKLFEKLKEALQAEIKSIPVDPTLFSDLQGSTEVGKVIGTLSHQTNFEVVERLAKLQPDEERKLADLEKKLAELKVNDPKKKAEDLRTQKRRIEKVLTEIDRIASAVSIETIAKIKTAHEQLGVAREASKLASQKSFTREPLQGVTTDPWKLMYEAAREFSRSQAYPGESFPVTKEGARCVFCFQELSPEAASRLKQFEQFVTDKTEKILKDAQRTFDGLAKPFQETALDPYQSNPDLKKEVQELNANASSAIAAWLEEIAAVRSQVLEALKSNVWPSSYAISQAPSAPIHKIIADLEFKAQEFDKIATAAEMEKLKTEYAELDSRRRLSQKKDALIEYIKKLQLREKTRACADSFSTTGVSKKNAELTELLVTDQLKQDLKTEAQNLHVDYIKIDLDKSGRQGVVFHKHRLQSSTHKSASLSDVLSEGEQKAIAIASFLAELQSSPMSAGIVFDDPVSSLDHLRRDQVARRLVRESKKRQVIIFTHDLFFLCSVKHYCKTEGADCLVQTVWGNRAYGTGNCDESAPWDGQTVNERIGYLKGHLLVKVKKLHGDRAKKDEYERCVDDFFNKLRQTWERAIEERLFNDSVQRFRESVEPQRLKAVTFEERDYAEVAAGVEACAKYLHDESRGVQGRPIPEPAQLETDLNALCSFEDRINKRNEKTRKTRP